MKQFSLIILLFIAGCSTPIKEVRIPPDTYVQPIKTGPDTQVLVYEEGFPFPKEESAYIWDASKKRFYFMDGTNRRYMHRGWTFKPAVK